MASLDLDALARAGAAARIEELRAEIATLTAAFPGIVALDGESPFPFGRAGKRRGRKAGAKRGRKRTMSAEARKKISDAQKKRWAAQKSGKSAKSAAKPGGYKRSAASRRKMAAAQKKRWAAIKAKKAAQG